MTTLKSFKKSNKNKKVSACKKGSASEAIGIIEKNTDTFVLTFGQFSLIDALVAVLDQTGPAHVIMSTWTASYAHLDRSIELLGSADILSMKFIIDRSFKTRKPKDFNHLMDLFGNESIRQMNTHAKFITIRNNEWDIVIRTSMNLNRNPRLENIEISENKDFAIFFDQIATDIFNEIEQDFSQIKNPELKNIKEASLFKEVSANYIKRKNLKEATFTHELRE